MRRDPATRMCYDRDRWYDPSTGGFSSTDPARSGANLYEYAGDDPTDFTDPSGLAYGGAAGSDQGVPNVPTTTCRPAQPSAYPGTVPAGASSLPGAGNFPGSSGLVITGGTNPPGGNPDYGPATNAYSVQVLAPNGLMYGLVPPGANIQVPPLPPDNRTYMGAQTQTPREQRRGQLQFQMQDSSLPFSQRNYAINKFLNMSIEDFSAEHPWLAMGYPHLVDPSNPGLGGVSGYENMIIAGLGAAQGFRGMCEPAPNKIPQHATDTLDTVRQTGAAPSGYRGGRTFANDGRGGGQVLPTTDAQGRPITYQEWDVQPYQRGVDRGVERIVTGSDGRAYYTDNHYDTFTPVQ